MYNDRLIQSEFEIREVYFCLFETVPTLAGAKGIPSGIAICL